MSFRQKIEFIGAKSKAVQIAKSTIGIVEFLVKAKDYKTRKSMNATEKQMDTMIEEVKGQLIGEKIKLMILNHLVKEYGSKKIIEAYDSIQGETKEAITVYFNELVCIKNADTKN